MRNGSLTDATPLRRRRGVLGSALLGCIRLLALDARELDARELDAREAEQQCAERYDLSHFLGHGVRYDVHY
jgi:hypothetical protein